MKTRRRLLLALLAALLLIFAGPAEDLSAGRLDPPGHEDANRCVNDFGVDLNALYGVSAQMQTTGCREQTAGEQWVIPRWWTVHTGSGSIYPPGYQPSSPFPIEDFASKLVAVKVVVDAGRATENVHYFAPADVLRADIDTGELSPGAFDEAYPIASILPRLFPLSVGDHTYQLFLLLSAQHCDGFGTVPRDNCLAAGEVPFSPRRTLSVTAPAPLPGGDVRDRLERIPGLTIVDDVFLGDGYRFFRLVFMQPVDHDNPQLGSFGQRLTLLHTDRGSPMVLHTTGYHLLNFPFRAEPTLLVRGNQISVEERFFSPSRPIPADWSQLTIRQAAADHHRVVDAFKTIYTKRWLSTGVSKGGMASVYHRRFYPDDVDGTIVYGAPNDVDDVEDSAYTNFFLGVGTDPTCRQALTDLQNEALGARRDMLLDALAALEAAGLSFHTLGSRDRALEVLVTELPFVFWQYYGQWLCPNVPAASATDAEIVGFIDGVASFIAYADQLIDPLVPYYVQAGTELGYPSPGVAQLIGLRYPGIYHPRSFVPAAIPLTFDPIAMPDIDGWVKSAGSKLLFIYGERDPWSAEPFRLGPGTIDSFSFTAPGANHLASLGRLTASDLEAAVATLQNWAGVGRTSRAPRHTGIVDAPVILRGRAMPGGFPRVSRSGY